MNNNILRFDLARVSGIFPFFILLFFFYSCGNDDGVSPTNDEVKVARISKVIFDGWDPDGPVQDTVTFHYENKRIRTVDWCTRMPVYSTDDCVISYTERRKYASDGKLGQLTTGVIDHYFHYEGDLLRKKVTFYVSNPSSTVLFTEYEGTNPVKISIQDDRANAIVFYVDLEYNASGDLIRWTKKTNHDELYEDVQIEYTTIENPLIGVMETGSYAVSLTEYSGFPFFYSKHVPLKIVNTMPARSLKTLTTTYQYALDNSGRVISASAFRDQYLNHALLFSYE